MATTDTTGTDTTTDTSTDTTTDTSTDTTTDTSTDTSTDDEMMGGDTTTDTSTDTTTDTSSDTLSDDELSQVKSEIETSLKDYSTTSEMEAYVSSEVSNSTGSGDELSSDDVLELINDNIQTDEFSDLETLTNKRFMNKNVYRRMFVLDYTIGQTIQSFTKIEDDLFKIDLGLAFTNFEEIEEIFLVDFFETSTYASGNVYTASSATAFYEDAKHKRYSLISKTEKEVVFGNNMENLVATKTYLIFEYTKI